MAKVTFKRYETDTEATASTIVDGQFIVTKEGSVFVDYGNERIPTGGLTITSILNAVYPVGSYYETTDTNFNPNTSWVGTWVLEEDGTALVSKSSTQGSIFNDTVGTIVGSETHTLTTNEIPSHSHTPIANKGMAFMDGIVQNDVTGGYAGGIRWNGTTTGGDNTSSTGGGQAHNIVQPSKIVNRWHRTE